MNWTDQLQGICPPDEKAMEEAQAHLDDVLKPQGSLGLLEMHMVRIAGMTGSTVYDLANKAVAVFCADNGVVRQGVARFDSSLTAMMAQNLAKGDTCVCRMAKAAGARVVPVDVGIADDVQVPGLAQRKVARGTGDFSRERAMTREEAVQAVQVGFDVALELADRGTRLLAAGEMGIGNTTSSAAVAAALLGQPATAVTGRGAGLSDEGLRAKTRLIEAALQRWAPDPQDPLEVLEKVGGLDIAAMAGFYLGAAVRRVPVVLDGVISGAAALVACELHPGVREYLLPSHMTAEPAGGLILERLGLRPLLLADMRLGEGTGAVATFPLYDMMAEVCNHMITFSSLEAAVGTAR